MRSLFRQLWFPFTEGFKPTPPSLLSLSLCQCSHFEIRPQKIHSLAGHLASPKTGPDTSRPFGTTQADQHSSSAADSRAAIGFHGLRPSDTASVGGVSWEPASGLFFGTPYCCWYSLFPKSRFVPLSLSVSSRPCQSSLYWPSRRHPLFATYYLPSPIFLNPSPACSAVGETRTLISRACLNLCH